MFGLPPSAVKNHLSGRVLHWRMPGPVLLLSSEEEYELKNYVFDSCEIGHG